MEVQTSTEVLETGVAVPIGAEGAEAADILEAEDVIMVGAEDIPVEEVKEEAKVEIEEEILEEVVEVQPKKGSTAEDAKIHEEEEGNLS